MRRVGGNPAVALGISQLIGTCVSAACSSADSSGIAEMPFPPVQVQVGRFDWRVAVPFPENELLFYTSRTAMAAARSRGGGMLFMVPP